MNIFMDNKEMDFCMWVNPNDEMSKHNILITGSFVSIPSTNQEHKMMFLPNPDFKGFISPFQSNLLRNYMAEYNLELCRNTHFTQYPPRLESIFLLQDINEAIKYKDRHPDHVMGRILKRVKTNSNYIYSVHDSSWVDFLRLGHMMDKDSINNCASSYWKGSFVRDNTLSSLGKSWTREPLMEVLFQGRIDFYNRNLSEGDIDVK